MKKLRAVIGLSFLLGAYTSSANEILYTVDSLGGNTFQYNYTLNNTGANALEWFSVYFDLGLYENLAVTASPADWDSIVFQPDPFLPDDGIFDSLALVDFLDPGDMLGGFSVSFDWLGGNAGPGSQYFEYVDSFTFDVLASGFTQLVATEVPEPATLPLMAFGFMAMVLASRGRRKPLTLK